LTGDIDDPEPLAAMRISFTNPANDSANMPFVGLDLFTSASIDL
jgi:hypothetical protein